MATNVPSLVALGEPGSTDVWEGLGRRGLDPVAQRVRAACRVLGHCLDRAGVGAARVIAHDPLLGHQVADQPGRHKVYRI